MIVSGSASQSLAAALAAETGERLAAVEHVTFPDGELRTSVPDFDADRAVVVAATTSSDAHVELLQLQDAVREAGAEEVVTVLPYMGYARQDRVFEPGQPLSARAVARAVATGTDRVLVVNPHKDAVCDFFEVPAAPLDAAGRLAEPLPDDLHEPVFFAPDEGALGLAESVRNAYGRGDVDHFEKTRLSGEQVEVRPAEADVAGRDVVLADDIVATGSTMSQAARHLAGQGADRTYATCVHPMLVEDALGKLMRAGVEAVYGTDTVERAVSEVTVAPVVAEAL